MVFLKQLKLSNLELNGRHHHSVFTGAQIVVSICVNVFHMGKNYILN